ncbi:phosphatidylserine decarboxylase family protein, putative (macronuclear) [Tetrahymena thermophila SB210]|uniref:Phosphatidylserine decarboxylase family protein, putative n=1 Tax=Tetrahymena thermophila (strain SB210) TaxID=312017 RepID=I7M098_TETTS|nr:phosphatidylserine decarboxylase family protein, putative [Tetrahymena thermophila SB210]EAR86028.2 phosphatidylserine decarboxylase family protein, putative [Tetrahymena thermophila SB210]|eukprot:XP_976623.2 phosphatidylserine decarboxylase family protein, putative [Tetrahymena thermophila SB210]
MSDTKATATLKKFDIFALPFQFTFRNNEKEKKTTIGGLISMSILIVSSVYFGYLCYLYFQNQVQPQVVSSSSFQKNSYDMQFQESFIAVQVLMPNGQNLYDFQQQTGKVYLNLILLSTKTGMNGQFLPQPLIPCKDNSLQGYLCLDSSKVGVGDNLFSLTYNPDNLEQNQYSIIFGICNPSLIQSPYICEDEQVIRKNIISYSTQITVRVSLHQYNTKTKQLEQRVKKELFYFDPNLAFYTKLHLEITDLTQQQGFIIQNSEYSTYFSGYTRRDIYCTQKFIKDQFQMNILGALEFFIGSESINLNIQYPQFTYLLAQFTSVFNSLLFLGIISKFFAESEIFLEVAEMQLKVYFKKSAIFLLKQLGKGEIVQREQQQGLGNLLNYIKNTDFKELGKKMKVSLITKIKYIFMSNVKNEKVETIQVKMFKQIADQSSKALNIFEIQKELLQMKIMMRLFFSVEQYAAIQLCGSKLPIYNEIKTEQDQEIIQDFIDENSQKSNKIDQQIEKSIESKEDKQKFQEQSQNNVISFNRERLNSVGKYNATVYPLRIEQQLFDQKNVENHTEFISHLEKIDMIERDEKFFKDCLEKFLKNKSQSQSEIDRRILECMIGLDDTKSIY